MTSLAEHLESTYDTPDDDEARLAFRIDSADVAEWAARKLRKASAESLDIGDQAERERRRIQDWAERERAKVDRDVEYFTALLIDWHRGNVALELAEVGEWAKVRHKSRALAAGVTVAARQGVDSWSATDPDAFVAWAEGAERHELIKVTKTPRLFEAKKVLHYLPGETSGPVDPQTGEVVPGLEVTRGEVGYSVTVETI